MIMKNIIIVGVIVSILVLSCRKAEYLPPEIGDKVPYTETNYPSLDEALRNSAHTLFYEALQKSSFKDSLAGKAIHTFLVADNATLTRIGWTSEKISNAPVEELDYFLGAYILKEDISLKRLQEQKLSSLGDSYRKIPELFWYNQPYYYGFANDRKPDNAYYQKAALSLHSDNTLLVNGKLIGAGNPTQTQGGTIWPVQDTLSFIPQTAWQVLKTDNRFSLYTSIIEYTDSVYNGLFFEHNGYLPLEKRQWDQIYFLADNHYHNTPRQQGMVTYAGEDSQNYVASLNTWFIPTNEAFQKAGFNTLEDLIALNESVGAPDTVHVGVSTYEQFYYYGPNRGYFYQPPFVSLKGYFATDSLLDNHGLWGMRNNGYMYWQARGGLLFFSNDLPKVLNSQLLVASFMYNKTINRLSMDITENHLSPLTALSETQVQVTGIQKQATITQPDLYTINGVIHVVDNILH